MARRRTLANDFAAESGRLIVELHKQQVPYEEARARWAALVERHRASVEPHMVLELQRRAAENLASYAVNTFEELTDAWARLNDLGFTDLQQKATFTVIFGRSCHHFRRPDVAIPALEGLIRELDAAKGVSRVWREGEVAVARRVLRLVTTGSETTPPDERRRSESLGEQHCFIGVEGEWEVKEQRRSIVRYTPGELDLSRCRWLAFHPIPVVQDEHFAELAAVDNLRSRLNELRLCGDRRLTNAGLTRFAGFDNLEVFFMQGYGRITFEGIAKLRSIRTVEVVDVAGTPSLGTDIPKLRALPKLETLRLHNECLTDENLRETAGLGSVVNLAIPYNRSITDDGVAHLAALPKLARLRLDGCTGVTDASLKILARLPSLLHIEAQQCSLTKTGIAAFRAARPDCKLDAVRGGASKV